MRITFITPVQHNGVAYAEGASETLKKGDAEALVKAGLALPADEAAASQAEAEAGAQAAGDLLGGGQG